MEPDAAFARALETLAAGGVVAAATESSFGLLADALSGTALDRLAAIKPRGPDKGFPLILPSRAAWYRVAKTVPKLAERLADAFWPGPLTLVLEAAPDLDPRVTLNGTVAVRLPGASPAAELSRRFGGPLTATSANAPGAPALCRSQDVRVAFSSAIGARLLDVVRADAPGGAPSTLVQVVGEGYRLLRVGPHSEADIAARLQTIEDRR